LKQVLVNVKLHSIFKALENVVSKVSSKKKKKKLSTLARTKISNTKQEVVKMEC
jgi:hypothetical protein